MTFNVCPADTAFAPVQSVWDLLMRPAQYGRFFDLTIERVEPEGPAAVGQRLFGWTWAFGRRWQIGLEIEEVDARRHQILIRVALPFGVIGNNRIGCEEIDEQRCLLRFG